MTLLSRFAATGRALLAGAVCLGALASSPAQAQTLQKVKQTGEFRICLLYTSPSPRD